MTIALERAGEGLRLRVTDRGTGIPSADVERIFEPGFTTKEFGEGSGVGLAVVRALARDVFRGTVEVQSVVGHGTVFTVALPIPRQRR